jgi:hypothetical protein
LGAVVVACWFLVLFAPVDAAVGDVGVDGGPDGGMEAVGSELLEEP